MNYKFNGIRQLCEGSENGRQRDEVKLEIVLKANYELFLADFAD